MSDDAPGRVGADSEVDPERPEHAAPDVAPPPLSSVRVKGPKPRGLNKPAVVVAIAVGVAVILVLASGSLVNDPSRAPAQPRPMMSDPARPEMARSAVRDLPATYTEAQDFASAAAPATPPLQLGPPLPGDVAAFAPREPELQGYMPPESHEWDEPPSYGPTPEPDPAAVEASQANRSGLFFPLRERAQMAPAATSQPAELIPPRSREAEGSSGRAGEMTLHPGTVIAASLVTEINSETPGSVIAHVTQSVFDSATGRTLLIPQGARLMGDYRSASRYGQSRLAIVWSRLIMPDGEEITLDEAAVDPSGAAGISGEVDNHFADVFGAAALGTLINIGVATTEDTPMTYGGIGGFGRDPVDAAISEGVQRGAGIVTNRVVDRGLAIPPTIRIDAGKRISVFVTRRIGF